MSQYENAVQFMAPLVLDYSANKRIAGREGNKCSYAAPYNAYQCTGEDRWCAIAVLTDEEWQNFCKVIGKPSLSTDTRFAMLTARKENEEELDNIITKWTQKFTAEEVMNSMQAAGIAAGVVETGEDVMDKDPQLKARNFFKTLEYPGLGKFRTQAGPHFNLSKYEYDLKLPPLLGEQNEYVFKEILGLPDDEYDTMVKEGVID